MLAPEYLDRCADGVIALYQRLDESIARDIARRLMKMGEITDTARWQAEQLRHAGLLCDDVIAEVAKYSGASETAVRRAFEDAGVESVDAEIALYREAGITLPPIRQSERAWNILQAALRKTNGALHNLTLTTAVETQQRFIAACTLAEMQVSSGMLDYKTAIRRAVQDVSREGASVLYPSGHADKLDVAVRRTVLTGVNQTCGQISETLAREFGCDLMEITAHAGARPSHAAWQGQIVSLTGRTSATALAQVLWAIIVGILGPAFLKEFLNGAGRLKSSSGSTPAASSTAGRNTRRTRSARCSAKWSARSARRSARFRGWMRRASRRSLHSRP